MELAGSLAAGRFKSSLPREVLFFDKDWQRFGRRSDLADRLSRITNIPTQILKQQSAQGLQVELDRCSVAQRMSWAASRHTSRIEDVAYCLMGIFNVVMKLLYGERERAFRRLQEKILRQTCDFSILAWHGHGLQFYKDCVLWAESPDAFMRCGGILRDAEEAQDHREIAVLNIGIRTTLPLMDVEMPDGMRGRVVLLSCRDGDDVGGTWALKVRTESTRQVDSDGEEIKGKTKKRKLILRPGWLWTGDDGGRQARHERIWSVYTQEAAQHKDPGLLKQLVIRHDNIKGMNAQLPGHAVGLPENLWVGSRDPKARL
jgi:hypothetical protein